MSSQVFVIIILIFPQCLQDQHILPFQWGWCGHRLPRWHLPLLLGGLDSCSGEYFLISLGFKKCRMKQKTFFRSCLSQWSWGPVSKCVLPTCWAGPTYIYLSPILSQLSLYFLRKVFLVFCGCSMSLASMAFAGIFWASANPETLLLGSLFLSRVFRSSILVVAVLVLFLGSFQFGFAPMRYTLLSELFIPRDQVVRFCVQMFDNDYKD